MTRRLHQWMPKLWKVGAIASGTAVISTAVVALPSPPFTVSASLSELPDGAIANLEAARQGLLRSSRAIYTVVTLICVSHSNRIEVFSTMITPILLHISCTTLSNGQ